MKRLILPKKILIIAALLGWSFDRFFFGKPLGVSLLLFVLLAVAALFYLSRSKTIRPNRANLWLLLLLLFYAGMVAIQANPFLTFLNVAATLFLLEFVIHFFTSGRLERLGFFEYPLILTWVAAQSAVQAAPLVPAAVDMPGADQKTRRNLFPVVRGLLLALPILIWLTTRAGKRRTRLFNALSTLMSALVMVMLVSAFQRLHLYEMAYGYTWLRLWVHTFMIWLGFVFLWFAIGFLATLNLVNPDQFVTRQNLARLQQTGDLDVQYLASLSNDALPTLVPALLTIPEDERAYVCADLYERLENLNEDVHWVSYNIGRSQAQTTLTNTNWQTHCPPVEELPELYRRFD